MEGEEGRRVCRRLKRIRSKKREKRGEEGGKSCQVLETVQLWKRERENVGEEELSAFTCRFFVVVVAVVVVAPLCKNLIATWFQPNKPRKREKQGRAAMLTENHRRCKEKEKSFEMSSRDTNQ